MAELRRRAHSDEGLGLIEVIISMVLFGIAIASLTPMLIGGLASSRVAQLNTQAKALGQERLELMRNLPYHVARQNGQYLDVLDLYYRDLQANGALAANDICSQRTYAAGVYRCTITVLGAPYHAFTQVVETRFLDADRGLLVPGSQYDSQTAGVDIPASNLLGVNVITSWVFRGKTKSFTVRTQIANTISSETQIDSQLDISALSVTSNTLTGDLGQLQVGQLSLDGEVANGSTAGLSATSAIAQLGSGARQIGANQVVTAPPAATGTSPADSSGHTLEPGCLSMCFGQTEISGNQSVTVANGSPAVSSATSQVTTYLRRTGSNIYRGFSFNNAEASVRDTTLGIQGPMVSAGTGGTTTVATASGYLNGNGTGATALVASGGFTLPILQLFPTSFAPAGVVQVQIDSASIRCSSGGSSGAMTAGWSGAVRYWNGATNSYTSYPVAPGAAALPDPATLQVLPASGTGAAAMLSAWVTAWTGLTDLTTSNKTVGRRAHGIVNSVVSVLTAPTRVNDPTSAINVAVGAMSCLAEDAR